MVNLHYLSTQKWQWAGQEGIKINKVVCRFAHYLVMLVNKVVGEPPTTLFSSERRYEAAGGFPTALFSFGGVQRAYRRDMVANKVVCGFHATSIGSRDVRGAACEMHIAPVRSAPRKESPPPPLGGKQMENGGGMWDARRPCCVSAVERPHPCIWRVNEQKTGAACGMHTAPIMLAPQKETPLHYWGVKDRGMWGQHVGCMPPPLCQPATPTPTSSLALLMPFPIPLTPTGQFQRLGPDIPQGGERQLFWPIGSCWWWWHSTQWSSGVVV